MISSSDFQNISVLIFDIDGTLTDGKVTFMPDGTAVKFFNMQDMHWLKLALRAGLEVCLLSGRGDQINRTLADELHVTCAVLDAKDKIAGFETLLNRISRSADECLYAGDDVVDLPVIRRAAIGAAVANGVPELDEAAQWRTTASGGNGAAAEIVRRVLKEKGLYDKIMERYRR